MRTHEIKKGMFLLCMKTKQSCSVDEVTITNDGYNAVYCFLLSDEKRTRRARFSVFSYETLADHGYKPDAIKNLLYVKE